MYRSIIRPLLFLFSPRKAHELLFAGMKMYAHLPPLRAMIRSHCRRVSPFTFRKVRFENRIGLSAGFDKNGEVVDCLADFGFGFVEVGTVTPHAQPGNPTPNIFRLVKDDSLISRTGFNNEGMQPVLDRLKACKQRSYVLGININKDAASVGDRAIADFEMLFREFHPYVDYFTLNWGSIEPELFEKVLERLQRVRGELAGEELLLVKLPADLSEAALDGVVEMTRKYGVDGFIATGPTMNRSGLAHASPKELEAIGAGGVSGAGIGDRSLVMVRNLAKKTNGEMLIIGAGGVMTPRHAMRMEEAGADLVQIYSAFIYSGPFVVREMSGKGAGERPA